MSKTLMILGFLFLVLSLCLERNSVESRRYDIVVSWKKHPPKCYHLVSYRIASDTRSPADCQRVCVKEKRCRTFHQYRDLYCYLSNNRFYEIGIIGCTRKIIIYEKVLKKVFRTKPPTTTMVTTTIPTTVSTSPIIIGPTPKWMQNEEDCLELESSYSEFKMKNEAECKLKCYLDEKCLVVEIRPDHFICKLSNKWRFKKVKLCNHWGKIFLKDLKKCPPQGEICEENAVCVNVPKTYECRCNPGYIKGSDGKCIKDVNECLESKDICDKNAVCIDTPESYECRCKAGYHKDTGKECVKDSNSEQTSGSDENTEEVEDDCAKNNRPCPENSVCVRKLNADKSECECIRGYEYKKHTKTCDDIDECRTLSKSVLGCTSKLKCLNTIGSYHCACPHGYKNVEGKCKDVDECAQLLCGENMQCHNFPGSYSCSCRKGYREEMYWCNDVDECRGENKMVCKGNQICVNAPGSYKCSCTTSDNCEETSSATVKPDEGLLKNHTVVSFSGNSYMRFATPAILKGNASVSIRLTIRPDSGNGIIIYAEKVGHNKFFSLALKESYLELSFNMGFGPEKLQSHSHIAVDTWHGINVIFAMDKVGFSLNEKVPVFQRSKYTGPLDVDDIFHIGGIANASDATPNVVKNLHTNFGFKGCIGLVRIGDVDYDLSYPGQHIKKQENISPCEGVQDIDECSIESEKPRCGPDVCTNTIGSFRCSCKPGYELADDVIRVCQDINECQSGNCGKNAKCKNTNGGYHCECTSGFYNYDTKSCQDGEPFPVRDGWFVNLGTCETSSCNRIGSRTTLENCKERCMKTPTCTMIKFKSSRGKCSLCESTKFRMPRNGGHCTPGDKYDFYMKALKIFNFEHMKRRHAKKTKRPTPVPSDSNTKWIVLRGLCVHTDSYNPSHIMTAPDCTRRCEAEPGCVMAKFSSAASLCWLSKSRKMAPLGNGCDGKFKNTYDYFVKPLDECDVSERQCPDHSECLFEKGHRYCKCRDGFEQHGKQCKDINECALYDDLCGEHAHCVNTLGSYKCSCNRHYIGDGVICLQKQERHAISFGNGPVSSS